MNESNQKRFSPVEIILIVVGAITLLAIVVLVINLAN